LICTVTDSCRNRKKAFDLYPNKFLNQLAFVSCSNVATLRTDVSSITDNSVCISMTWVCMSWPSIRNKT